MAAGVDPTVAKAIGAGTNSAVLTTTTDSAAQTVIDGTNATLPSDNTFPTAPSGVDATAPSQSNDASSSFTTAAIAGPDLTRLVQDAEASFTVAPVISDSTSSQPTSAASEVGNRTGSDHSTHSTESSVDVAGSELNAHTVEAADELIRGEGVVVEGESLPVSVMSQEPVLSKKERNELMYDRHAQYWESMRLRAPDAARILWAMGKMKWKNANLLRYAEQVIIEDLKCEWNKPRYMTTAMWGVAWSGSHYGVPRLCAALEAMDPAFWEGVTSPAVVLF